MAFLLVQTAYKILRNCMLYGKAQNVITAMKTIYRPLTHFFLESES
jgi:hypothetical protein